MSSSLEGITGEIIVVVKIQAKPGSEHKVIELIASLRKKSIGDGEPGCLAFNVARSGNGFIAYEKYKDTNALKQHTESDEFKTFVSAAEELLLEKPSVTYYEELF